jgi:hypothetical protein
MNQLQYQIEIDQPLCLVYAAVPEHSDRLLVPCHSQRQRIDQPGPEADQSEYHDRLSLAHRVHTAVTVT